MNQWLLDGLGAAFPGAAWTLLSEETAKEQLADLPAGQGLAADWLWILDPLDGTEAVTGPLDLDDGEIY